MDKKYLKMAMDISVDSQDPNTQVGAVIVLDGKVVSTGYNALPNGCNPKDYPLDNRETKCEKSKYPYIVHAEANAILSANGGLKGASMYVTLFPCNECCKLIINAGIKDIIYTDDKYNELPLFKAGIRMLNDAGVECRKVEL